MPSYVCPSNDLLPNDIVRYLYYTLSLKIKPNDYYLYRIT